MLRLGTAKITCKLTSDRKYYVVEWMNHGSQLNNIPRWYVDYDAAVEFCRDLNLQII